MEHAIVPQWEDPRVRRTDPQELMLQPRSTADDQYHTSALASGGSTNCLNDPPKTIEHGRDYPVDIPSEFDVAVARVSRSNPARPTHGANCNAQAREMERILSRLHRGLHFPSRVEQDTAPRGLTAAAIAGVDRQPVGPGPSGAIQHWLPAVPGYGDQAGPMTPYTQAMQAGARGTQVFQANLTASTDAVTNSDTTGPAEKSEWTAVSHLSSTDDSLDLLEGEREGDLLEMETSVPGSSR